MCSLHSVTRVWATRWAACSDEAKKGLAPPKMWRAHNAGRPRGCARQSLHKKQEGRRRRVDTSDPDRPAYERAHNGAGVSGARLPSTPFPQPCRDIQAQSLHIKSRWTSNFIMYVHMCTGTGAAKAARATRSNKAKKRKKERKKKRPGDPQTGPDTARPRHTQLCTKKARLKNTKSRLRHVVAAASVTPASTHATGRGGRRGTAPTPFPHSLTLPNPQQAPLPDYPSIPAPILRAARVRCGARGGAVEGAAATATAIAIAIGGACSRCGRGCGEPDEPIDPQSTLRGEGGLFFHLWSTHRRVSMGLWARHAAGDGQQGKAKR